MLPSYFRHLLHLIFPSICIACKSYEPLDGELLCLGCLKNLPFISSSEDSAAALEGKDLFPSDLVFFQSLFYYTKDSKVADLIHDIKYDGQYRNARYLGFLLGRRMSSKRTWIDYTIVPVPIHPKRKRSRGFNQAEEISLGIADFLNCPVAKDSLVRTRHGSSQTGKDKLERSSVLQSSFKLNDSEVISKKIILVDDVITTGATINACVKELRKSLPIDIAVVSLGLSI